MEEMPQPVRREGGGGRGLSTARSVLKVLTLLAEHPDGVRACQVAERLGKSTSTAYYLLASLCEEGFAVRDDVCGRYRLLNGAGSAAAPSPPPPGVGRGHMDEVLDALFARTAKRCYLGRLTNGAIEIVGVRGRQGLAKMPGLGTRIEPNMMHALAMGKVVLSLMPSAARLRYARRGLQGFTPATITSPEALVTDLEAARRRRVAAARQEFHLDFCCAAAPLFDARGRFLATVGLSVTARTFDLERDELIAAVREVAAASKHLQKTAEILRLDSATA